MSEAGSRRAVAEIRFGEDRKGITQVGGRSIHHYWKLLSPHFRDVLLSPQRRSDDGGVVWSWRELTENKPLTAAELASVRKRLERGIESFAENPVSPLMGEDLNGAGSQALVDQVVTKVKAMVETFAAKTDTALAESACRTEAGVMIHSWGVATPAQIIYPDGLESGISGVVRIGDKPGLDYEVVIENAQGLSVARTKSDKGGGFVFPKIGPGRYRVRVTSGKVKFPAKGVMLTVERGVMSRVELASTENPEEAKASATPDAPTTQDAAEAANRGTARGRHRSIKVTGSILLLLLLVGGGIWAWRLRSASSDDEKRIVARGSSMMPEEFLAQTKPGDSAQTTMGGLAAGEKGLGASADGVGSVVRLPGVKTSSTSHPRSPSVIGSAVETQADAEVHSTEAGAVARPEGSRGMKQAGQASAGKSVAAIAVESTAVVALPKPGALPMGTAEAVALDNTKPLPGGNQAEGPVRVPGEKKKPVNAPQGAVPVEQPRAEGNKANAETNSLDSEPSEEGKPETLTTEKPATAGVEIKAPPTKSLVVNKARPVQKTPPKDAARSAEGKDNAETEDRRPRDASVAKSVGEKEPKGTAASQKEKAKAEDSAGETPLRADDSGASTQPSSSALASKPEPVPASAMKGTVDAKTRATGTAAVAITDDKKGASEKTESVSQAAANTRAGSKNDLNEQRAQNLPPEIKKEVVDSSDGLSGAAMVPATMANDKEKTPSASPSKTQVLQLRLTGWEARWTSDAILPTLPVREGEGDSAEAVRAKLIADLQARMPATFSRPSTRHGLVFGVPDLAAVGVLRWKQAPGERGVEKTALGNRAELSWQGVTPPRGSVHVLSYPDGREAVRLTVNDAGELTLVLAEGVSGDLWLSVVRAVADEAGLAPAERDQRFSWQVKGRLPYDGNQLASGRHRFHRLDFRLDSSTALSQEIALLDTVSGWQLVARLELTVGQELRYDASGQ